jgi:hypothetical protein
MLRIFKADSLGNFENGQMAISKQAFALFDAKGKHISIRTRIHTPAKLMQKMGRAQLG